VDSYYLVTTATPDRSNYSSLAEAQIALGAQLGLQVARGFQNRRNPSGRFMSRRRDSAVVMLWIEDDDGQVCS
jgi:hypothetical protein